MLPAKPRRRRVRAQRTLATPPPISNTSMARRAAPWVAPIGLDEVDGIEGRCLADLRAQLTRRELLAQQSAKTTRLTLDLEPFTDQRRPQPIGKWDGRPQLVTQGTQLVVDARVGHQRHLRQPGAYLRFRFALVEDLQRGVHGPGTQDFTHA